MEFLRVGIIGKCSRCIVEEVTHCFLVSNLLPAWPCFWLPVLLSTWNSLQALNRRLQTAPQKLFATVADTQAVQAALCACLAAAFGTKVAFEPVGDLLRTSASTAAFSQDALVASLLELSCTGTAMPPDQFRVCT